MVNEDTLNDLIGKECIVLESGRGTIAILLAVWLEGERFFATLETTHSTMVEMNRIRMNGESAIAGWHDVSHRLGNRFNIMQPKQNVFRGPNLYLHFSSPYGGTRLLFLSDYIDKMRRRDNDGWEWDDMMEKAHGAK